MSRWLGAHRAALIIAMFVVTTVYVVLALVSKEAAETVGIGYLIVLLSLFGVLRLPHGHR